VTKYLWTEVESLGPGEGAPPTIEAIRNASRINEFWDSEGLK